MSTPGALTVARGGRELYPDAMYQYTGNGTTVSRLLAQPEFYIAHRGSGGNWPEHSMTSYVSAARWGMDAIEVSVQMTSDGVLVCLHDEHLLRATGVDAMIADTTWAQLSQLTITANETHNDAQPAAPVTRVRDVLDLFLTTDPHIIFLEAKHNRALQPLIDLLADYPNARDYIVWKRWVTDPAHQTMHEDGYTTWGYVLPETSHFAAVDDLANRPYLDLIGVWHLRPDTEIGPVVDKAIAAGRPTIMWEVRDIATRDRARALGVRGFMTQNIQRVVPHRLTLA